MRLPVLFGFGFIYIASLLSCLGHAQAATADLRQAAISLQQAGRFAEAADEWRIYVRAHPQSAEGFANFGLVESRQEHYREAIPLYRKAMALDPMLPGIQLDLGLAYFKSGALKEANETFTSMLKSIPVDSPEYTRISALIGLSRYSLGEYTSAIPFLRTAANSDPQSISFRFALAQSCLSAKQYQCVLDAYHEILKLNAESAAADMLAGQAYDEMKNSSGAIEQFRAAVKADPKWPNAHFGLGYLLWTQNQFDEAAKELQAELDNVPDNAQAMTYLADCKIQLGQMNEALPIAEKAVQVDPGIAKAHMDLGVIYQDQGQLQDALRELTTAVRLMPRDSNIHWRLARLYQAMGRKEEAKMEFEKTSSLHKAENESVFTQLKEAQQKEKSSGTTDADLTPK